MTSPWMTTQQAADYLGFSRSTITQLARSGELKASQYRAGAEYRFKVDWLDDFLESNVTKKTSSIKLHVKSKLVLPEKLIQAKRKAKAR
jgi:excisionase family DNA binding protein